MKHPTPQQIINARNEARITQTAAAHLVGGALRTWQNWESGASRMRPALWELFLSKVKAK